MSVSAIDPVRDPYRAESARLEARADLRADGVARAQTADFPRIDVARAPAGAAAASMRKAAAAGAADPAPLADSLREMYAGDRLKSAVQAFLDEQAMLRERADAANDLGTIQGLLPLQAYRFAIGNPLILPPPFAAPPSVVPATVSPVSGAAPLRSATDEVLGTDSVKRDRIRRRRPDDVDADVDG